MDSPYPVGGTVTDPRLLQIRRIEIRAALDAVAPVDATDNSHAAILGEARSGRSSVLTEVARPAADERERLVVWLRGDAEVFCANTLARHLLTAVVESLADRVGTAAPWYLAWRNRVYLRDRGPSTNQDLLSSALVLASNPEAEIDRAIVERDLAALSKVARDNGLPGIVLCIDDASVSGPPKFDHGYRVRDWPSRSSPGSGPACGLRRGELRGLQWLHVDFDAGVIRVERSWDPGCGRSPRTRPAIARSATSSPRVWTGSRSRPGPVTATSARPGTATAISSPAAKRPPRPGSTRTLNPRAPSLSWSQNHIRPQATATNPRHVDTRRQTEPAIRLWHALWRTPVKTRNPPWGRGI
jgi:hypothetical protein